MSVQWIFGTCSAMVFCHNGPSGILVSSIMALLLCGLNHRSAPLAWRESLAMNASQIPACLQVILAMQGVTEVAILSTCHRTEFILDAAHLAPLQQYLQKRVPGLQQRWPELMYCYHGEAVIRHLLEVACGLDSQVLGEPEILGQMKRAYAMAKTQSTVGPQFHRLFAGVFSASKKIRQHTTIGKHSISMAHIVWQWAKQLFAQMPACRVLLVGAGEMNALVAAYAQSFGIKQLMVASRTDLSPEDLAHRFGPVAEVVSMTELPDVLKRVDMVVSAANHGMPVVGKGMVESALAAGRRRPMLMVDLAMPRSIEPEIGLLPDVYLHNLDDMQKVLAQHHAHRAQAADAAQPLLNAAVHALQTDLNVLRAGGMIERYRERAERVTDESLTWARAQLRRGDDPDQVLTQLAHQLSRRLMHLPTVDLRKAAARGDVTMPQDALSVDAKVDA